MSLRLVDLAHDLNKTSVSKGFWTEPEMMDKYVAKLALISSEVTEVLEALRKNQGKNKVTEEFADIIIRTLDLYAVLVDAGLAADGLDEVLELKAEANKARPALHGHVWG